MGFDFLVDKTHSSDKYAPPKLHQKKKKKTSKTPKISSRNCFKKKK